MGSSSVDLNKMISYSEGGIVSKELARDGAMNVTLFCMARGTELSEHTSTREGTVFVLEGGGTFTLEGNGIVMAPGTLIRMPKAAVHSIKASSNLSFLLHLGG